MGETLQEILQSINDSIGVVIYIVGHEGDIVSLFAGNGEGIEYLIMVGDNKEVSLYLKGVRSGVNTMIQQRMIEREANKEGA